MSEKPGSLENGTSRNEKQHEGKKEGEKVLTQNNAEAQKLTKVIQRKPTGQKSPWKIGFGTTKARVPENPLTSVSAYGLKVSNKKGNFEVTAGVGMTQEQKIPGHKPESNMGGAIALNWEF